MIERVRMKQKNPKHQIPNRKQYPISEKTISKQLETLIKSFKKIHEGIQFWFLGFGAWLLFDIWCLEFGNFPL